MRAMIAACCCNIWLQLCCCCCCCGGGGGGGFPAVSKFFFVFPLVFLALPFVLVQFHQLFMLFIGFLALHLAGAAAAAAAAAAAIAVVVDLRHDGFENKKREGGWLVGWVGGWLVVWAVVCLFVCVLVCWLPPPPQCVLQYGVCMRLRERRTSRRTEIKEADDIQYI